VRFERVKHGLLFYFRAKGTFSTRIGVFWLEKFPGGGFPQKSLKNYPLYFAVIDFMR
jgi:hypothetical protein